MILSGRRVPERSGGLFPQDVSLPFELSVSSPNPSSCSDSAHASLTKSSSARASNRDSRNGGVIPSGNRVPEQRGGLFPITGLLLSKRSKKLGSFHNTPSGNVICPVVWRGGNYVRSPSYSDNERDVVHAAFFVTTATHDSGSRKGRDQPHVSFPVVVRGINQSTLIKKKIFLLCHFSCNLFFLNILKTITLHNRNISNTFMSNCFNIISFIFYQQYHLSIK